MVNRESSSLFVGSFETEIQVEKNLKIYIRDSFFSSILNIVKEGRWRFLDLFKTFISCNQWKSYFSVSFLFLTRSNPTNSKNINGSIQKVLSFCFKLYKLEIFLLLIKMMAKNGKSDI